ncbi:ligase-associated DNA damage response endonuclease PdeM [Mesorhizobium sp. NBSH29]|uniref:ligase-associated DNA damage response endonuclease PdeM n=1 Tax=Mesorhizobium sp. NBSH29 TaxID=2654249 RepID=UPI00189661A2|nr:ligase-associated DNA damage response endonuclease PdeM [Mesorhizobium sp. NBSH29]QPC86712.1 ligase-associated DNA damage response endonuclease PdeM [Mesorhizobium sp. NBSH29]
MNESAVQLARRPGEILIAGERALCNEHGVLYFPEFELLVVSDLHLEKGAAYARRGSMVPPYDTQATLLRLAAIIAHYDPRRVISLGDSFHDGKGAALMPEVFRLQLAALMAGREWFWVTGNHDPEPPVGLPGETVQELAVGALTFRHEPSRAPAAGEIAGHLHPCARIVQRGRSVRRRCFASDGSRLIMPAFGSLTGSLNVLDRAYAGLFQRSALMAYMLGAGRIYPIASAMLRPG